MRNDNDAELYVICHLVITSVVAMLMYGQMKDSEERIKREIRNEQEVCE